MPLVMKLDRPRGSWFTSLKEIFRDELEKTVPARLQPFHYLGALTLIVICLQIVTGILLMVYYRPVPEVAYASVRTIAEEVRLGWLVQGLHHWGADFLVFLAVLHLVRVYMSRAYQAPRHYNWMVGLLMFLALVAFAFTGTLLPWDQYAYWSTYFARQVVADIPAVGAVLLQLLWGGETGGEALGRFYVFHVGILPWMTVCLLLLHLMMVWRLGIKEPVGSERTPFLPDVLLNLCMVACLTCGLLLLVATLFPPLLLERANPLSLAVGVKPRWYFLPLYELLRYLSGDVVVLIVAAFFVVLLLVPVLDRHPDRRIWKRMLMWGLGLLVLAGWFCVGLRGYLS